MSARAFLSNLFWGSNAWHRRLYFSGEGHPCHETIPLREPLRLQHSSLRGSTSFLTKTLEDISNTESPLEALRGCFYTMQH